MMDYEPITKELRDYASVAWEPWAAARERLLQMCDNIDAIHRSLEAENERLRDASERGDDWIKLPLDADRVPTREGDELWSDDGIRVKVKRLQFENGKWSVFVENKVGISFYAIVEDMHHYNPDTWERIIEDALGSRLDAPDEPSQDDFIALVERCKALCERTKEGEE